MKTLENLDETKEVLKANKAVILFFYAVWCSACKRIGSEFDRLGEKIENNKEICLARVDIDIAEEVVEEFRVPGGPYFLLFVRGKQADEVAGATDADFEALGNMFERAQGVTYNEG